MSTNINANLYDTSTNEIFLVENVPLQDRKGDLRQLLKLLNLSKSGQPKAVLISGDPGIGKTALIDAFVDVVCQGLYCRVIDLRRVTLDSAEKLYVEIIEALQRDAEGILDAGLKAVNEVTVELGLAWDRQDLLRSIALVKLQESIGGKDAVSQERLVKAIRSSVPTVKKLKFTAMNESIEKLVDIIVNPWLLVAATLINPMTPQLQEAIQLARTLRSGGPLYAPITPLLPENRTNGSRDKHPVETSPPTPRTFIAGDEFSASAAMPELDDITTAAFSPITDPSVYDSRRDHPLPPDLKTGDIKTAGIEIKSNGSHNQTQTGQTGTPLGTVANPVEILIQQLLEVFGFINRAIHHLESGLFMVMDDWDKILDLPENRRTEMKELLAGFLRETQERKNFHFMLALGCRSEGESYALGGTLYGLFRNKLLLSGLNQRGYRKLFLNPLKQEGYQVDDTVTEEIFALTRGNPFWILKAQKYIQERAATNNIQEIDRAFYQKLGLFQLSDILEFTFTRLKLTLFQEESQLYKVIAALIQQFGDQPFEVQKAFRELSISQNIPELFVCEVLRYLFQHDFLSECHTEAPALYRNPAYTVADPHYHVQSRIILNFLKEKTRAIQTDVSRNEKLGYLKRIIPLSVRSGELDREKTIEILALSQTMGDVGIGRFLEEVFSEYLEDPKPIVRVTALNNIAVIESEKALEAIVKAVKDPSPMVREYAIRNLTHLAQRSKDFQYPDLIVNTLIDSLDDENDTVRAHAYATLTRYKWNYDLLSVFLKGMTDACEMIRTTSIQQLVDLDVLTPVVKASFTDALDDACLEVRKYAYLGIQKFPEAASILIKLLKEDPESSLRTLAAEALSRMEDANAFEALVTALEEDPSEDVKLSVVRALGKRRGWRSEEILHKTITRLMQKQGEEAPALLWTTIRCLGNVAGTERSLETLREVKRMAPGDIIQTAVETSRQRIQERIEDLRLLEKQLETTASPTQTSVADFEETPLETIEEEEFFEEEPALQREAYPVVY